MTLTARCRSLTLHDLHGPGGCNISAGDDAVLDWRLLGGRVIRAGMSPLPLLESAFSPIWVMRVTVSKGRLDPAPGPPSMTARTLRRRWERTT